MASCPWVILHSPSQTFTLLIQDTWSADDAEKLHALAIEATAGSKCPSTKQFDASRLPRAKTRTTLDHAAQKENAKGKAKAENAAKDQKEE